MIFNECVDYRTEFSGANSIYECNYILISEMCVNLNYDILTEGFVESVKNLIDKFIQVIRNFFAKIKSLFVKKKVEIQAKAKNEKGKVYDLTKLDFEDYDYDTIFNDLIKNKIKNTVPYGLDMDIVNCKPSDQKILSISDDGTKEISVSGMDIATITAELQKITLNGIKENVYKDKIEINEAYARKVGITDARSLYNKVTELYDLIIPLETKYVEATRQWKNILANNGIGENGGSEFISYMRGVNSYNSTLLSFISEFYVKYTTFGNKIIGNN